METTIEVTFVIVSSYSSFQPESYLTRAKAEDRMARIAAMDPDGFSVGAYWITRYAS